MKFGISPPPSLRPRARSIARGLFVLGSLGIASILAAPGFGCAGTTHGASPTAGDDAGGESDASQGGSSSGGGDSGVVTAPPPPAFPNLGVFAQSCNAGDPPKADWSPMRRISRIEYNNMVRDLLGDTTQPANSFPPESPLVLGVNLASNTYAYPSTTSVQDYLQAAETLADAVVNDTNRFNNVVLNAIPSCGQAKDDTCAKDFIASFANRAYRGQLDDTESQGLLSVYSAVKAQFDWPTGMQAIITAVLESPRFLYVMELGAGNANGNVIALSPYEVAARLSLFLWRSVPDVPLMTAAAMGQLSSAAQVQAQAQRMLAVKDSQGHLLAQSAIDDFTTQWMQLTGVLAKDPQFVAYNKDTALPSVMNDETRLDLSQLVLADNGTLTDLLTSKTSYVDQHLATFYGVSMGGGTSVPVNDPVLGQENFSKTAVPNRPGILSTAGVLATQAHSTLPSFVLRGKLVRENVLCDPIGNPPPNIPAAPSMAPDAGTTTRDLLMAHQQKGTVCPGCHKYMDSIGEGFGNFDATGTWQATDANGQANGQQGSPPASAFPTIDPSGNVAAGPPPLAPPDPTPFSTTFTDVNDLTTQLAGATQVKQCFALQEFRYALGRLESTADGCSAQQIYSAFSSNQFNLQQLLVAIVGSDAFRYRSVETAGSACQ